MEKTEETIQATDLKSKAEKAIADGYTYCIRENFEDELIKLKAIADYPDLFVGAKSFILCEKEPTSMQFSDDKIAELVIEHLDAQEEFYTEEWESALEGCDDLLKQLTDKINQNLTKHKFWFPSNDPLS